MINFCPPRSSTGKWVVLRRELGGNAVDEKSVAVGIGVGYQEDPRWAKRSTPLVRGGGVILKNHLSCTVCLKTTNCRVDNIRRHFGYSGSLEWQREVNCFSCA